MAYKHLILATISWILCSYFGSFPPSLNLIYQHTAAHFVLNRPWTRGHHDGITEMLHTLEWTTL